MGSCTYILGEEAFCKQVNKKTGALKHGMTQRVGVMGMGEFSKDVRNASLCRWHWSQDPRTKGNKHGKTCRALLQAEELGGKGRCEKVWKNQGIGQKKRGLNTLSTGNHKVR